MFAAGINWTELIYDLMEPQLLQQIGGRIQAKKVEHGSLDKISVDQQIRAVTIYLSDGVMS